MSSPDNQLLENFDSLVKLAKHDPEAFEHYRKQLIEQAISSAPASHQMNMRRFQWRIEQETRHHHSSLGRCVKLSAMMTERLQYLSEQIGVLRGVTSGEATQKAAIGHSKVVALKKFRP